MVNGLADEGYVRTGPYKQPPQMKLPITQEIKVCVLKEFANRFSNSLTNQILVGISCTLSMKSVQKKEGWIKNEWTGESETSGYLDSY
jgi:hypothetical protein